MDYLSHNIAVNLKRIRKAKGMSLDVVAEQTGVSKSMLATIAGYIAPIFAPLGFGDWRTSTALITGFIAKESVVSTLSILMGNGINEMFTTLSAASFLTFCLLYTPCVAAVSSIKRELGRKWAFCIVILQCTVAWLCAGGVYLVGRIIGM